MYPIQMTFTVSTPADLARLVAATVGEPRVADIVAVKDNDGNIHRGVSVPEHAQELKKHETKKSQPEKAASAAPPADTPATPATTAALAGAIDFTAQIQKPIVAMAAGGRRAEALAILKELGASKASEIKPEDYARAVELIAKAG